MGPGGRRIFKRCNSYQEEEQEGISRQGMLWELHNWEQEKDLLSEISPSMS